MKVRVQRDELTKLTAKAAAVANQKAAMPILSNVVLRAKYERLHIEANDLFTAIRSSVPATVESAGEVAVPARELKDVVAKLPGAEVTIELEGHASGGKLHLRSGRSRYRLPAIALDEWPTFPSPKDEGVEVDAADLVHAVECVECAASKDASRPHMNGVLIEIDERRIRAVTTDGHRLHVREVGRKGPGLGSVLVSPKGVSLLRGIERAPARLSSDASRLFVMQGETLLAVQLTEERFPPYEKIVPQNQPRKVCAPREATVEALRRLGGVGQRYENGFGAKFSSIEGALVFESENSDAQTGGREEVEAHVGESEPIGVNGLYLAEALAKCPADEVEIHMGDALDPLTVRADGYLAVVMPMRL